mmetsp:Transcript_12183/g.38582  ORF Transcript_12183/g.38582 Transcript_12183/m.38582 type:complete len:257 (-) Transcript_12183:709-1479(-)
MISPPLRAITTCAELHATCCTCFLPGVFHSLMRRSARMCRSPEGCTWSMLLSARSATWREGVVPRNPLSFTSSTVSPMLSTSVALTKDTTMYESYSSVTAFLTVHTALGLPGSSDTAISDTARPGRSMRSVERGPLPHRLKICGVSSPRRLDTFMSVIGLRDSMSSSLSRFLSPRGLKNTGWKPSSVSMSVAEEVSTSSSSSPRETIWYSAWLPNSEAAKRNPVFMMHMAVQGVMVSKYLTFTSLTVSSACSRETR